MERVMKLTKDFNNMQNYMNKMDFVEPLIIDASNQIQRNSTSKTSQYGSNPHVMKSRGQRFNMISHGRPDTMASSPSNFNCEKGEELDTSQGGFSRTEKFKTT